MKHVLFILMFSVSLFAQEAPKLSMHKMNPDGYIGYPSFHFTPYFNFGESEYSVMDHKMGKLEYPLVMDLNLEVKLPVSETITLALYYRSRQLDSKFKSDTNLLLEDGYKGSIKGWGFTFSYYFKPQD